MTDRGADGDRLRAQHLAHGDRCAAAAAAEQWWGTPLGCLLLRQEQALLDPVVQDVFGYHALQLGMPWADLLRESRIAKRAMVDRQRGDICAEPEQLPFPDRSIDLLVLPHVLEFSPHPHAVLREANRVLMPEGRLLILGFNPFSLWGLRRLGAQAYPWLGRYIGVSRLHDWLKLLDLEVEGGSFCAYTPPLRSEASLARWAFMEKAGDRWWPGAGGAYLLQAVKRVRGLRVLERHGVRAAVRKPVLVATGRTRQQPAESPPLRCRPALQLVTAERGRS